MWISLVVFKNLQYIHLCLFIDSLFSCIECLVTKNLYRLCQELAYCAVLILFMALCSSVFLSTCLMPSTVLDAGDVVETQRDKVPAFKEQKLQQYFLLKTVFERQQSTKRNLSSADLLLKCPSPGFRTHSGSPSGWQGLKNLNYPLLPPRVCHPRKLEFGS